MSVVKFVDRCKVLCEVAEGVCCRAYYLKEKMSARTCMTTPDFAKIRQKLDRSFPDIVEAQKVQGYDALKAASRSVLVELQWTYDLLVDAAEFTEMAIEIINETPIEVMGLELVKNRSLSILYLELIAWYMRVVLLISAVEEKKVYLSLYNIAHGAVNNTTDVNTPRVIQMLQNIESPQNHFIHEFKRKDVVLGPLLVQFLPVLRSRANTDMLKNKNVLNPLDDGELMGLPAIRSLPESSQELSMFTELAEVHKYSELAIYALIACPILLYTQECLDVFKLIASENLVVPLYRDLVINIHQEFESISAGNQLKKDATATRSYKLKPVLKEVAKDAAQRTGLVHRERRSFLCGELSTLNNLFLLSPGLLGPKFPQAVAAASLARSEILNYFSHIGQETRKDVKKVYDIENYQPVEVMSLFGELFKLYHVVVKYRRIIQNYYIEYLSECDAQALDRLNRAILRADSESLSHRVMENIQLTLAGLVKEAPESCVLQGMRFDWARLASNFSSNSMHGNPIVKSEEFANLTKRMNAIVERTNFVDNLDGIFRDYFLPYNVWWQRGHVKEIFVAALNDFSSASSVSAYASSVIYLSQIAIMTFHEDCPEEFLSIGENSVRFCDECVTGIVNHIEASVVKLWDFYQSLDNMIQPIEAANRLEKTQKARQNSNVVPGTAQPLPGYESTFMYRPTINQLIQVKRNLVEVVSSMDYVGTFVVFNREYNLALMLRQKLHVLFENRLKSIVFKEDTKIERPSVALQKLIVGCHAIQDVISLVDGDSASIIKNIFFKNFVSLALPPPGSPAVPIPKESANGAPLIWRIASWFVSLVETAATTDSGLVWVVSQKMFARTKNAFPVDMFLNPNDLTALCTLVGSQGIRVIIAELVRLVNSKVEEIKEFVSLNSADLIEFSANYHQSIRTGRNLKNLSSFFQSVTVCGVALAVRELLCSSMEASLEKMCPVLGEVSKLITEAVDPWQNFSDIYSVHCLAADCGHLMSPDLALVSSLRSVRDPTFLSLLPAAFAAILTSPQWSTAFYFPALEAFGGNEHCIVLTLSRLLECYVGIDGKQSSASKKAIKAASEKFLQIGSHVLVMQRCYESDESNKDKPLRAMVALLELFVKFSSTINRGALEKCLPYSLIHDCQMDIAMGKTTFVDQLSDGFDKNIS